MDILLTPPSAVVPDDMDDYRLNKLRQRRNQTLQESDWTQQPDIPMSDELRAQWATYRQALRDLPASVGTPVPETVTFPDKPE